MPENAGKLSQFLSAIGANNFVGANGKSAVAAGNGVSLTQRSSAGKTVPFPQRIGRAAIIASDARQPVRQGVRCAKCRNSSIDYFPYFLAQLHIFNILGKI